MVACRIPGCLFYHVPEIVGRHAQLVRAVLHGRQAVGELEPILEVAAEQAVETDQDVVLLIAHVQGLVHPVVEKRVAPDVPFERKAVEQVGMEQERPAGNGHPFSVVLLAAMQTLPQLKAYTGAGVFPSDR